MTIQDQIFLKLLSGLREELGVTLVFVSHDLAVIAQTCQRVAVMYNGMVVETGTVDEVFREKAAPSVHAQRCCARCHGLRRPGARAARRDPPGAPPDLAAPPMPAARSIRAARSPRRTARRATSRLPAQPQRTDRATACIHPDNRCRRRGP